MDAVEKTAPISSAVRCMRSHRSGMAGPSSDMNMPWIQKEHSCWLMMKTFIILENAAGTYLDPKQLCADIVVCEKPHDLLTCCRDIVQPMIYTSSLFVIWLLTFCKNVPKHALDSIIVILIKYYVNRMSLCFIMYHSLAFYVSVNLHLNLNSKDKLLYVWGLYRHTKDMLVQTHLREMQCQCNIQ